jgi:hypothetical protein
MLQDIELLLFNCIYFNKTSRQLITLPWNRNISTSLVTSTTHLYLKLTPRPKLPCMLHKMQCLNLTHRLDLEDEKG